MYLTVKETAEYLSLPAATIESLILQKRIRALYDGEQYLIYKEQFNSHFRQLETYKQLVDEFMSEPIPDDLDVRDED
jgi:excisionase family DNA binding protein